MSVFSSSFDALLLGTFTVAALHALIPSHWLAFALVGRAQRWTTRRTVGVAALAGAGHVLLTTVLGMVIAAVGKEFWKQIPPQLEHLATAGILIALGVYFALPSWNGRKGCRHSHEHQHADALASLSAAENSPPPSGASARIASTKTVMGTLVLGMTLSPCLDLLSVYVAASSLSWAALLSLSLVMAATTLTLMSGLVWLTSLGLARLNLRWLDENEGLAIGGVLVLLGILLFFL